MSPLLWLLLVAVALVSGMAGCVVGLVVHFAREYERE